MGLQSENIFGGYKIKVFYHKKLVFWSGVHFLVDAFLTIWWIFVERGSPISIKCSLDRGLFTLGFGLSDVRKIGAQHLK